MSRRALLVPVLALALAGCGGGDDGNAGGGGSTAGLPGDTSSRGAELVASQGCLGCHQLGQEGNSGPGPELTQIGSQLSQEEIEKVLVDPEPPMPSFADEPEEDRTAIAEYLASLK